MSLLDGTHARGAFALRAVMQPPWSICVAPESPLTLLAAVRGSFWITPDSEEPLELRPGDIAVARPNVRFVLADNPNSPPDITIFKGQDCRDRDGKSVSEEMTHGVRTWGNDPQGQSVFVVGAYEDLSETSERLERMLPPLMTISRDEWSSPLVGLLCDEVCKDDPGQAAVLDRIVDLVLTSALRAWFARTDDASNPVRRSKGDPVVERALRLLYNQHARQWTIDDLASLAHVSRASLARRFHDVIGEPPMAFLAKYRMALAADLLQKRGETIGSIAAKVGYQNPFAFSVAFKRIRGVSPKAYRATAMAGETQGD